MFKALIGYIRGRYHGKKLRLFELPPSTPFTVELSAIPGASYTERGSYHIPLSDFEDFDAYYMSLNKKLRHNIKTRSNHFTHGDLTSELKVFTRENPPSNDYWKKIWRLFSCVRTYGEGVTSRFSADLYAHGKPEKSVQAE